MKLRRAFTLIELLVVIAIIAILAAILFPVFAQAKLAAKASASLSNTKQIGLGIIMYTNDYDDMWPLSMAFNESNAAFNVGSHGISPWSYTIFPYIKTAAIYMDPVAGNNNNGYTGGDLSVWEAYNSEYGYNWTLLNGGFDNAIPNGFGIASTSSTSIARPSDMVMVTTTTLHTAQNYIDYFYDFVLSSNPHEETYASVLGVVEGPYCDYQTTGCNDLSSYWGISNGWGNVGPGPSSPTQNPQNYIEGAATSGNAMRDNGLVVTAFTDGHSKALSIGALAVGTNWNPTFTKSQVQLTDKNTYRWWQY